MRATDLREMAKMESAEIEERLPKMEEDIKLLLIPADPEDDKNAILKKYLKKYNQKDDFLFA